MRTRSVLLSFTLFLFLFTSCMNRKEKHYDALSSDFVYSTYTVGGRLKSVESLNPENFKEFNCIYLVAPPQWVSSDFDLSYDSIIYKYVDRFDYEELYGNNYVETYISNAHKIGCKVLCSFQGRHIVEVASVPERRLKFAGMIAEFINKYNYDGVEIDWEHTLTIPLHNALMKDIRQSLDKLNSDKYYFLTTALHPYHEYTKEQADEACKYLDWINLMFYDMGGGCWGQKMATHNSPLDEMKKLIKLWNNFPPHKICIGLASYGFYYKDLQPGIPSSDDKTMESHGRYCSYTELPPLQKQGWYEKWDSVAQCSYFISPDNNEFMTLESERSMDAKIKWIKENCFKGVFWWEFHCDWIQPENGESRGKHLIMDYVTKKIK